jgi:hypothetical protein
LKFEFVSTKNCFLIIKSEGKKNVLITSKDDKRDRMHVQPMSKRKWSKKFPYRVSNFESLCKYKPNQVCKGLKHRLFILQSFPSDFVHNNNNNKKTLQTLAISKIICMWHFLTCMWGLIVTSFLHCLCLCC